MDYTELYLSELEVLGRHILLLNMEVPVSI